MHAHKRLKWHLLKVVILNKFLEFLDVVNRQQILLDMRQDQQVIYKKTRRQDRDGISEFPGDTQVSVSPSLPEEGRGGEGR